MPIQSAETKRALYSFPLSFAFPPFAAAFLPLHFLFISTALLCLSRLRPPSRIPRIASACSSLLYLCSRSSFMKFLKHWERLLQDRYHLFHKEINLQKEKKEFGLANENNTREEE